MSLRSKNELEASSLISRSYRELETEKKFGSRVFNSSVMEHMLPEEVQKNIRNAKEGIETIKVDYADFETYIGKASKNLGLNEPSLLVKVLELTERFSHNSTDSGLPINLIFPASGWFEDVYEFEVKLLSSTESKENSLYS